MMRKLKQRGFKPLSFALQEVLGRLDDDRSGEMTTGLTELDLRSSVLTPGNLIVVGSPPSGGKTNFVLSIATNVAIRQGHAVGIFSLESTIHQTASRILAAESQVTLGKVTSGQLTPKEQEALQETRRKIKGVPLFIDAVKQRTDIRDLLTNAERTWERGNLDLLIVDYIQLLHDRDQKYGSRDEEVDSIVRSLKHLARTLEIPVIAVSQAFRQLPPEEPSAEDLENASSLIQHADLILLIHRPEVVPLSKSEDLAHLIIAKDRRGCKSALELVYLPETCTFRNLISGASS